jgi:coenzyme F420-reducing hydrogenase beta subunit
VEEAMAFKKTLARLLFLSVLELGALCGAAVTPEEIEKILNAMNKVKIVQVVRTDGE